MRRRLVLGVAAACWVPASPPGYAADAGAGAQQGEQGGATGRADSVADRGPSAKAQALVHGEVAALLARLAQSGCRFQRNDRWHTGPEARAHLMRKWQSLERQSSAASTEQFIDQAASRSLTTGKPYLVQCGDGPTQPSQHWLLSQLAALRAATGGAQNP